MAPSSKTTVTAMTAGRLMNAATPCRAGCWLAVTRSAFKSSSSSSMLWYRSAIFLVNARAMKRCSPAGTPGLRSAIGGGSSLRMLPATAKSSFAWEGALTDDQLVQHDAERPHVGARVDWTAANLLG